MDGMLTVFWGKPPVAHGGEMGSLCQLRAQELSLNRNG